MPWKASSKVTERMEFLARLRQGERMTDLCREFGISRKTGHKIARRFQEEGAHALHDRSRRPFACPHQTPRSVVEEVVRLRKRYTTWGPKKLKERLHVLHPEVRWPAASTIGAIIKDEGLSNDRKRRRRAVPTQTPLRETAAPNELWSIDFKGEFALGNKKYCYPLTVSDHFSRYLLGCEALDNTRKEGALVALEEVFHEFGLPDAIRSDNGAPFASTGLHGLTQLSVRLMRLGIRIERIEPGHPEQNGRHERIHLTLKQEATRPAGLNALQQQERFDNFREVYNSERPHESLGMQTPASVYQPSQRKRPAELPPLEYPLHDMTRLVTRNGTLHLLGVGQVYIGAAFVGENVGLRQIEHGTWLLSFMDADVGYIDAETRRMLTLPATLCT